MYTPTLAETLLEYKNSNHSRTDRKIAIYRLQEHGCTVRQTSDLLNLSLHIVICTRYGIG